MTFYQGCSSRHDLSKNMSANGRRLFSLSLYIEHFKNLLIINHWTDFNTTWQECCLGDPLKRLFKTSRFVKKNKTKQKNKKTKKKKKKKKNMAARGWNLFSLSIYMEDFKNLLVKPLDRFQCKLAGMFFWRLSTKNVQAARIRQKHGH